MDLVVDASVAVKWFVEEDQSDLAALVLAGDDPLHAPRLLASEVSSALWRKALRGEMELGNARTGMASLARMPITWHADETLAAECLRLAAAFDRSVYDCLYLALAYRLGARLVTADLRFANALAAAGDGSAVMPLKQYPEESAETSGG